jgi:hypothetical protein
LAGVDIVSARIIPRKAEQEEEEEEETASEWSLILSTVTEWRGKNRKVGRKHHTTDNERRAPGPKRLALRQNLEY